jgi:signal transduction histidine kinase
MKLSSALIVFVLLLLSVFLGAAYSLVKTSDLLDLEATHLAEAGESARVAEELKSSLLLHNRDIILHSVDRNIDFNQTALTEKHSILQNLERAMQWSNSPDEEQILKNVKKEVESYLIGVDISVSGAAPLADKFVIMSRSVDDAIFAINKLVRINREQMAALKITIDQQNVLADKTAMLLISVSSAVLLGLTLGMVFMVVRPLLELSKVVSDYGLGDTAVRADRFRIFEIRNISTNFNSMADRLEERSRDRLRFIASIAHDLRNPICSMSMASELLLSNNNPEDKELVSIILRQIKGLDRLVGDLLDTARNESGQLRLESKDTDLVPILSDSVELHKTSSKIHKITLNLNDKKISLKCDPDRIHQVLNNLLSNAIKYSPTGGEVRIDAKKTNGIVQISICDQGIGIAENDLKGIFKPFQRTVTTQCTIPGIGLGLSVSRHIIEAHGGTLTLSSRLGEGSTFVVELPIIPKPA